MLRTIKSKIIFITVSMLLSLSIVIGLFSYIYLKTFKNQSITSGYYTIEVFAKNISKDIVKIEDNARDLAVFGRLYGKSGINKAELENEVKRIFEGYQDTLGGGIWFEPYVVDPDKKLSCIYAFRDKNNLIKIDRQFETEQYNYLQKDWYKEIKKEQEGENTIVWTTPYYEKEGSDTLMVTAGAGIYENGKFIGMATADREISKIANEIKQMNPTKNSFALFADVNNDYIIVCTDPKLNGTDLLGKSLSNIPWYHDNLKNVYSMDYEGKKYVPYVKKLDNGMVYIVCVPHNELFQLAIVQTAGLFITLMLISIIMSLLLYFVLQKYINTPIDKLKAIANKISKGKLDEHFEIDKPEEFSQLAAVFNKMTKDIRTITKEREHTNSELSIARAIQYSSLPNVFPPYPNRNEFEIFASMDAAKEVGGDFYDFCLNNNNQFMFLVADVSGKGIPAALFMMTVKTLISNYAESTEPPEEVMKTINKKICENNKYDFFVTLISGIVDLETGKTVIINCGHNPPLIQRNNGNFEYLKIEPNIVLGIFENAEFKIYETMLNPGDKIFFYTDGITEAADKNEVLFGEQRLLNKLNDLKNLKIEKIIQNLKEEIKNYSGEMPQSDDMTMLMFKYNGAGKKYVNKATTELYGEFLGFIKDFIAEENIETKQAQALELISEEIYANTASYAYGEETGDIEVSLIKNDNEIITKFINSGTPYNPQERENPDINAPLNERPIGGLGIYMIKKKSKSLHYEYIDGRNILTVVI